MVAEVRPAETAAVIRERLNRLQRWLITDEQVEAGTRAVGIDSARPGVDLW